MAQRNKAALKALFETGDTPTGADFADMIDSSFNPSDDSFPAQRTDAEVVASVDAVIGNENWKTQYSHPASHSIDMINESATHVKMTTAERTKLTGVETNAKDDQTGSEIAALIDTELGAGDWRTGGQDTSLTSNPATITKTSAESFADLITKTQALGTKNYGGYSVNIQFGTGNHNIGASDIELLRGLFNGEMNWDAQVASAKGSAQTTTITTNAAGMILIKSLGINLNISHIKFIVGASGSSVVLSASGQGNITTYRCAYDVSSASAESTPIVVDGISFTSNEDTFIGSPSQVSNFIKSFGEGRGGEVNIFNAGFETNKFTNATSGLIKAAFSNSDLAFTNKVANGSIDVSASVAGSSDKMSVSSVSSASMSETGFTLNITANRVGTAYWGVYANGSATPTVSEIIGGTGTGLVVSDTVATLAGSQVSDVVTGLSASTEYDVYVVAMDSLGNASEKKLVEVTTTAPAATQLTATVLSAGTPTSSTIPLTFTDTNTSPNEEGVLIEVSDDGSTGWTTVTTAAADATGYTVTGLAASTTKYFRATVKGNGTTSSDSVVSNTVSATTLAAGGAFAATMKADYAARNPHFETAHQTWVDGVIDAAFADGGYYQTNFNSETDASWFDVFKINGATTDGYVTKNTGDVVVWDVNGVRTADNLMPDIDTGGADQYLILHTTDAWSSLVLMRLDNANIFHGNFPDAHYASEIQLLNTGFSGTFRRNSQASVIKIENNAFDELQILDGTGLNNLEIGSNSFSGTMPLIPSLSGVLTFQAAGVGYSNLSTNFDQLLRADQTTIRFNNNNYTESEIDACVQKFYNFYQSNVPTSNNYIRIDGTNANPSAAAQAQLVDTQTVFTNAGFTLTVLF